MSTKDKVLTVLLNNQDKIISGGKLADQLGLSRNAIWKVIQDLNQAGYHIESIPRKGYQLQSYTKEVDPTLIHYLSGQDLPIHYLDEVTSTNDIARNYLLQDNGKGVLIIAKRQTAGRGRRGRYFYSDLNKGLYMSLGLEPQANNLDDIPIYTLLMASALILAVQEEWEIELQAKWVNDLFYNGKKVVGILSEMVTHLENYDIPNIVLGAGINLAGDFSQADPEIQKVAGTLFGQSLPDHININQFVARFLKHFFSMQDQLPETNFLNLYQDRLLGLGQEIRYLDGDQPSRGVIKGINERGHLLIEDQGEIKTLFGQDISFTSQQFLK